MSGVQSHQFFIGDSIDVPVEALRGLGVFDLDGWIVDLQFKDQILVHGEPDASFDVNSVEDPTWLVIDNAPSGLFRVTIQTEPTKVPTVRSTRYRVGMSARNAVSGKIVRFGDALYDFLVPPEGAL